MPRSAASIQAEITTIEAQLSASSSNITGMSADGVSITRSQRKDLESRLDLLYLQADRAAYGIVSRGRMTGMGEPNSGVSP